MHTYNAVFTISGLACSCVLCFCKG